jgi:deoxyribodipyrimidine photo-lyase
MPGLQLVWFKRDLRVSDHRPLLLASERGPVLPLLVVEPELWRQPDASARQWAFAAECAEELRQALAALGQPLVVRCGDAVEVLERARRHFGVAGLWSHEETGNGWTYGRDRRVAAWARSHGIPWHELPQFGVVRRLASRDGWARRWEEHMAEPISPPPAALQPLDSLDPGRLPSAAELGLAADPCPQRQRGGRSAGLQLLESFLAERGQAYQRDLSSPNTAFRSCSRLSPHLAWGSLSLREVLQACRAAQVMPPRSRRAFDERLHWHCHFIQKLESQPDLEFRELHPLTAGLRDGEADWLAVPQAERLAAWSEGRTGLPFVDACMRALAATGWLNFRMRAMVMSVASYHLWLPWRASGLVLARLFVDYEPGIHWSSARCSPAPPASTPCASTTRSSRVSTTIPRGCSSAAGCRNWRPCRRCSCISPGGSIPCSSASWAGGWAAITRRRSWIPTTRHARRGSASMPVARSWASLPWPTPFSSATAPVAPGCRPPAPGAGVAGPWPIPPSCS